VPTQVGCALALSLIPDKYCNASVYQCCSVAVQKHCEKALIPVDNNNLGKIHNKASNEVESLNPKPHTRIHDLCPVLEIGS